MIKTIKKLIYFETIVASVSSFGFKYAYLLLVVVGTLLKAPIMAQTDETNTLLGDFAFGKDVSFMVAPSFAYTRMDGDGMTMLNLRAGGVIKRKLALGGFYAFSIGDTEPQSEIIPNLYMDYRAVGGFLEYTLHSDKLVHFTFPLLIGVGEVEMDNDFGSADFGESSFLVVEPSALLEINLHQYIKINLGVTYRFVGDMSYRNLDNTDISGVVGQVGLKLGIFK